MNDIGSVNRTCTPCTIGAARVATRPMSWKSGSQLTMATWRPAASSATRSPGLADRRGRAAVQNARRCTSDQVSVVLRPSRTVP
jgi:hypothetical protein